jgi:uncharacterized protein (DUF2342 family)
MGIDSIGKKGPPSPPLPSGVAGASHATPVGRPFEVPGVQGAGKVDPVEAPPRTALDRLRAGEIDVNGYVDIKVNEATSHLAALPPAELEQVRRALRDRMAGDPTLVDLVRTATGAVPQPSTDE